MAGGACSGSRTELARFVETTSMKGVGRAYKSPISVLRAIWGISVCLFLGLACYQTYELLDDYLQFPTVTHIEQVFIDSFVNTDSMYEAPDLTLCNLNPYASDRDHEEIPSIRIYSDIVHNATSDNPITAKGDPLQLLLLTTSGYFQYIGAHNAFVLGNTWREFMVDCHMEVFDGFASSWQPCNDITDSMVVTDPQILNCFTLKIQSGSPLFIAGYSLVIHLDNFLRQSHSYFTSQFEYSRSLGAVVVPHMRGTKAWVERNAIHLPPGIHTDLKLHMQKTSRLKPPYGECEDILYLEPQTTWAYSVKGCISSCLEELIHSRCGCKDAYSMNIRTDTYEHSDYCLQLNVDNITETLERYNCAADFRLNQYDTCYNKCPPSCTEIAYSWDSSISLWPSSVESELFYDKYIANQTYESWYKDLYRDDMDAYDRAIRENFVSVDMYISNFNVIHHNDVRKTSFFSLLSSLGAALNLWAGITVVLIVELVEVVVRICMTKRHRAAKETPPPPNTLPSNYGVQNSAFDLSTKL